MLQRFFYMHQRNWCTSEISAEKSKLMTNNTSGINTEIKVNGQQLEMVTSFKNLGSVIIDEGPKPEILSRIEQTTAALTRLKPVWNERSISQFQDTFDALPWHIHLPVCLWIMDSNSRAPKKNTSIGSEVLLQDATHLIQKPCYHWGSLCQDPAGNWTTWRPPDHCKEMQTAVVWTCLPFIRSGQNHLARHSERGKKTRQTEEEVGRQTEEWSNIESCVWLTCQKEERSSIQSCVWPTRQGENWWSTEIHTWLTCHEEHGRSVEKTGGQGHSQQREEQGFSGGRVAPREQAVKHINITSMCWWFFFLLFVFGLFACTGRF